MTTECTKDVTLRMSCCPKKKREKNKTPAHPELAFKLLSAPLFIKMLHGPGLLFCEGG